MEISPFDAKIIEMLSRIDEEEGYDWGSSIEVDQGANYNQDLVAKKLLRIGTFELVDKNDEFYTLKGKGGLEVKVDKNGRVNGKTYKDFLKYLGYLSKKYKENNPVEEADIPLPSAPSVGDMPEGPSNLVTGEMPMPDAAAPHEDAPIEGEEEEEKETPEGIREYIDMIRRALTLDPNTLELSDFQKKALYTTVTAKNAEDKLKVYNKILNDYDPIEQPSEVPNYDPYATKNS